MRLPRWARRCRCRSHHRDTGHHVEGCPRYVPPVTDPESPGALVRRYPGAVGGGMSPDEVRADLGIDPFVDRMVATVVAGELAGWGLDEVVRAEVVRQLGEMVAPRVAEILAQTPSSS